MVEVIEQYLLIFSFVFDFFSSNFMNECVKEKLSLVSSHCPTYAGSIVTMRCVFVWPATESMLFEFYTYQYVICTCHGQSRLFQSFLDFHRQIDGFTCTQATENAQL